MSNLTEHAKNELKIAGFFDKDSDYDGMIGIAVMELVEVFAKQGHSGMSASLVRNLFDRVADFLPIEPITCEDSEWNNSHDITYQNKRCSSVFKDGKDGKPYYLEAIVWRTPNGMTWTGSAKDKNGKDIRSRQFIKTPFIPKTFYVDVLEKEIAKDDWEFYIKDESQLDKVFEYYEK